MTQLPAHAASGSRMLTVVPCPGPRADDLDPAAVLLHDALADGQPQARSLPDLFGGEEGVEDLCEMLRRRCRRRCPPRRSRPSRRNRRLGDWAMGSTRADASSQLTPRRIAELPRRGTPRGDRDLAAPLDRIQGVGEEVQEDLLEHLRVARAPTAPSPTGSTTIRRLARRACRSTKATASRMTCPRSTGPKAGSRCRAKSKRRRTIAAARPTSLLDHVRDIRDSRRTADRLRTPPR